MPPGAVAHARQRDPRNAECSFSRSPPFRLDARAPHQTTIDHCLSHHEWAVIDLRIEPRALMGRYEKTQENGASSMQVDQGGSFFDTLMGLIDSINGVIWADWVLYTVLGVGVLVVDR